MNVRPDFNPQSVMTVVATSSSGHYITPVERVSSLSPTR
jgi:hypothetical protein